MPMFKIEYGMDVPAYGETLIHARSLKAAQAEARKLYQDGGLIDHWEPIGEMSENHRVLTISRDAGDEWKIVDSAGFDLDEPKTSEPVPPLVVDPDPEARLLWIAYDFETDRVIGHTDNAAGAVLLANHHRTAKIGRVSF